MIYYLIIPYHTNFIQIYKKPYQGFSIENPGTNSYQLSVISYGSYARELFELNDFTDRKELFESIENFNVLEELTQNENMALTADLPKATVPIIFGYDIYF